MQNYTPIIISFLLLLGNTSSSQALMTANELELSANFLTQHAGRGNAVNNHGDLETVPSGEGIRKKYKFFSIIPTSGQDNQDLIPHRGSGR